MARNSTPREKLASWHRGYCQGRNSYPDKVTKRKGYLLGYLRIQIKNWTYKQLKRFRLLASGTEFDPRPHGSFRMAAAQTMLPRHPSVFWCDHKVDGGST
eukprot:2641323-Rhodomonas_salina.3